MAATCTARSFSTSPGLASMRASPRVSPSRAPAAGWWATSSRRSASCAAYEPGCYSIHNACDVEGKSLVADIVDRPALFIALANSRQYGSGAQIAPRALLDDGMMEIVVVEPQSAEHHEDKCRRSFSGTLKEGPVSDAIAHRWRSRPSIRSTFHVDGEPERAEIASLRPARRPQSR
jgi:hypothetical protein